MTLISVVPANQRRALHMGDKGRDVLAYQRMLTRTLRRLGWKSLNRQTGLYGHGTLVDTLRLQHHAVAVAADGVVGPVTWSLVDPQMHAYERALLHLPMQPPATAGDRIAHQMEVMYALGLDEYSQIRPSAVTLRAWKLRDDCSGSTLLARHLAIGTRYNGIGNTETIWDNWLHVTVPARGDAALYGVRTRSGVVTKHVQVIVDVSDRSNPDSIGFGSAPGNRYRVHDRHDFLGYRRGA